MNPDARDVAGMAPERKARNGRCAGPVLRRIVPAGLAGLGLAVTLAVHEWVRVDAMLVPASVRSWAVASGLLILAWLLAGGRMLKPGRGALRGRLWVELPSAMLLASAVLFLFTGATLHPWTYFHGWLPHLGRGLANAKAVMPWFILLTAAATPFLFRRRPGLARVLFGLLVAAQIASFAIFLHTTGGAALYKDDHSSFLFRLWEFARTFPQYLNYNPWWNGGAVNAYCTSSGTGALGLLLLPLWRWIPVHEAYTPGLGLIYIGLLPWMAVASLRIMGASRVAAACAGLLALGVSRHFFLWLFHYGTACAPLVASFTLPVAACVYRVVWLDRREKWLAAALVGSAGMLLQWPPGGLMALPIAAAFLLSWRQWSWKKIGFLALCAGIVLALCSRLLLVIGLKGGAVVSHVMGGAAEAEPRTLAEVLEKGFHFWAGHMQEGHPVLLFFGFAGLVALSARSVRRWFGPALLLFFLIAGWGPQLKPKLELGRMAIPMMFLAVGPAAIGCARLLRGADWRLAPARAALVVLLGLGGWNVARLYGNQGSGYYQFMPEAIHDFAARLRSEVPEGGRVMFAGPAVHYFGRGHVAYLPCLVGREMMAVDYYHFPTTYVQYEYPPAGFNQTPEQVLDFIRLYNITHVVTYHERWKAFFRGLAGSCEELGGYEGVAASVFRMRREPTQFLRGSGRVAADFSRLAVQVDDPGGEAVLCYNWVEGLSAPAPVELFPHDAGKAVRLIGIRPNGTAEFSIRYRSWL
ncbi:MAG: hypothetical protein EOM72_12610 [Opitutae bacterium]|nr:hypothetical protein [Opitutae bacterium]